MRLFLSITLIVLAIAAHGQFPTAGLQAWYRADKVLVDSAGGVIRLADFSGNGYDAVCATFERPRIIDNALNGYPSIQFNGFSTGLQTCKRLNTFPGKRGSIVFVVKINGRSTTSSVGTGNIISTYHGDGIAWQVCGSPKSISYYDGVGGEGLKVGARPLTGWNIIALVRNTDTTFEYYINRKLEAVFKVNNNLPTRNTLKIGYNALKAPHESDDDIREVLNGDIAEILLYDHALTPAMVEAASVALGSKYNIGLVPEPYYKQWWFYLILLVAIPFIIASFRSIVENRRIKKQLAELKIQQEIAAERIRISQDIHDEIGSGLSRIALLAATSTQKDDAARERNLGSIAKTSTDLVDNMRDLVWALNPDNNWLDNLVARMREYAHEYFDDVPIALTLNFSENIPHLPIAKELQRNAFLVYKEALNNAVKHAQASVITIGVHCMASKLTISVSDNGAGFDPSDTKIASNGLRNMQRRMEAIGGHVSINSSQAGTIVEFRIPVTSVQ